MLKNASLFILILAPRVFACDPVKVIAKQADNREFHGTAFPMEIDGKQVFITTDHTFRVNRDTIDVTLHGNTRRYPAKVIKRDWAHDLALIKLDNAVDATNLHPCRESQVRFANEKLAIPGYSVRSANLFSRSATIFTWISDEIITMHKVKPIKVEANVESAFSGAPLVIAEYGEVIGMVTRKWHHDEKFGALVQPIHEILKRAKILLNLKASSPRYPFRYNRETGALEYEGMRFKPRRKSTKPQKVLGGHPDDIGGTSIFPGIVVERTKILTGNYAALNTIFQLQESPKNSVKILVHKTTNGEPIADIMVLARQLSRGRVPKFDFSGQVNLTQTGDGSELDMLLKEALVLTSRLKKFDANLDELFVGIQETLKKKTPKSFATLQQLQTKHNDRLNRLFVGLTSAKMKTRIEVRDMAIRLNTVLRKIISTYEG